MVRRHLEQLHRSALTMTALITDLSHGFSLDDHENLELERLDLVELVASVVDRTQLLADGQGHEAAVLRRPVGPPGLLGRRRLGPARAGAGQPARQRDQVLARRIERHGRCRPRRPLRQDLGPRPGAGHQRRRQGAASSRSSTARRTPPTCPVSASGCSSPSRSRRATAARSGSSPSAVRARPSCCRCRCSLDVPLAGSLTGQSALIGPYRARTRTCYSFRHDSGPLQGGREGRCRHRRRTGDRRRERGRPGRGGCRRRALLAHADQLEQVAKAVEAAGSAGATSSRPT